MKFLKTATLTCLVCAMTLIGLTIFESAANAQRGRRGGGATVVAKPGSVVNIRNGNGNRFAAGPAGFLAPRSNPIVGVRNLVRNVLGGALNLANNVVGGGDRNFGFRNRNVVFLNNGYGYRAQDVRFLNASQFHGYHGYNQALLLNRLNTFHYNNLVAANLVNRHAYYTANQPIIVNPSGIRFIHASGVCADPVTPVNTGVNYITDDGCCNNGAVVAPSGVYYIRRGY